MSGFLSILPEEEVGKKKEFKLQSVFEDYIPITEVKDKGLLRKIAYISRKWADSIENFAQYAGRRLAMYGILAEVNGTVTPTPDGFTVVVHIRIVGVNPALVEPLRRGGARLREAVKDAGEFKTIFNRSVEGGKSSHVKTAEEINIDEGEEGEEDIEVELVG